MIYHFIAKETAYYYCDDICITIIKHHKGRDTFFRVYDGVLLSKYSYIFFNYAEYPNETYIYIRNKKVDGKIIIENFTLPVKYYGKLNNAIFYLSTNNEDDDDNKTKFVDLKNLNLLF